MGRRTSGKGGLVGGRTSGQEVYWEVVLRTVGILGGTLFYALISRSFGRVLRYSKPRNVRLPVHPLVLLLVGLIITTLLLGVSVYVSWVL